MEGWQCEAGSCLMIPSGPSGEHLFAIVMGPVILNGYGPAPQVLMVSFTSVKPGIPYDDACIVHAGEHPFITKDSYIYYREPRLYPAAQVESYVKENLWRPRDPCGNDLLSKVMAGFWVSKRLPRSFRKLLEEAGY